MPPSSKSKPRATKAGTPAPDAPVSLNKQIKVEIARLASTSLDQAALAGFAEFVIRHYKDKDPAPLKLTQLKKAVLEYFEAKTLTALKKSGSFKMATQGMIDLDLSVIEGWETLYRKFIGVLPNEDYEEGYGCINGINIFKYFYPWRVFGLDPKSATPEDIKRAYGNLQKVYHPDIPGTGDARISERLTIMYKSISAEP